MAVHKRQRAAHVNAREVENGRGHIDVAGDVREDRARMDAWATGEERDCTRVVAFQAAKIERQAVWM